VFADRDDPVVLCHGLVASDFLARTGFPVPRDVKVRVDRFVRQGGGPAANAAVAVARLGGRAVFVGAVGDDALGVEQVRELEHEGVDTSGVTVAPGRPSFVSFILVDASDGGRTIYSAPAEVPHPPPSAAPWPDPRPHLVLVDGWGGEAQLRTAEAARAAGLPVLLDAGSLRDEVEALLPHADVVIGSTPFAEALAGSPAGAVARLIGAGARLAAITRGPDGVLAAAAGAPDPFEVPAFPVEAVDTTGAGDAFHGGAAWALAAGRTWAESLRVGAAVAALKCREAGARAGLPSRAAVEALTAA
jgi:sulfofructose kinase